MPIQTDRDASGEVTRVWATINAGRARGVWTVKFEWHEESPRWLVTQYRGRDYMDDGIPMTLVPVKCWAFAAETAFDVPPAVSATMADILPPALRRELPSDSPLRTETIQIRGDDTILESNLAHLMGWRIGKGDHAAIPLLEPSPHSARSAPDVHQPGAVDG